MKAIPRSLCGLALSAFVIVVILPLDATAQPADRTACEHYSEDPQFTLAACAKLIESPAWPPDVKALAHAQEGRVYDRMLDQPEQALTEYSAALALWADPATYRARGQLYGRLGRTTQAIMDLSAALDMDHENATLAYERGVLFLEQSQYSRAAADFEQALKADPNWPDALEGRAEALFGIGQGEALR